MSTATLLGSFAAELRRRHVARVAVGYCAVGWIVAQAGGTLLPPLGAPYWTVSVVTALVVLGLPVALVLAWAYDVTPSGVMRTPALVAGPPGTTGVLVLALTPRGADPHVLGEGVSEELVAALAREGVPIVSRTSIASSGDGAGIDLRDLAARYAVSHVVEGSVGAQDERLRVQLRLVASATGQAVWSGTWEQQMDDPFCAQQQVARSAVAALRPVLAGGAGGGGHGAGHVRQDADPLATYMRGRQRWEERTPDSLRAAIALFESAVARDGGSALAHAGLADCWAILVDHGVVEPAAGLPAARAAAVEAARLGPDLAETHAAAALVHQLEWRWADAERAFRAAIAADAEYHVARQRLALLLAWLGRGDEARSEILRAEEADPLSPVIATSRTWVEYYARSHDAAIAVGRRALEHGTAQARVPLALALIMSAREAEAIELLSHDAPSGAGAAALALALGRTRGVDEARAVLPRVFRHAGSPVAPPAAVAHAWLGAGEPDRALLALENAAAARVPQLIHALHDPALDELRDTPRFNALRQRLPDTR